MRVVHHPTEALLFFQYGSPQLFKILLPLLDEVKLFTPLFIYHSRKQPTDSCDQRSQERKIRYTHRLKFHPVIKT